MSWQGRRVLVTGAGGFIGSHLAERLVLEGARVTGFVHYNALGTRGWLDSSPARGDMRIVAGDIGDRDSVREAMRECQVAFHLAALIAIPYSYVAPASYVSTNIGGTLNVLQAAREFGLERLVHTSTSEVYGTARSVPIDETHPLQGQSPYSASKIGADKIAESFHLSFGVPVVTVRPFNAFGPRQSARAIIPTIVSQALAGGSVRVGNVKPTRDLNFVSNTVDGFLAAGSCPNVVGETFNLGSGREISVADLIAVIGARMGRTLEVEVDPARLRPAGSEVDRLLADASRAGRQLGWTPRISLEDGLARTIDWIASHAETYRPDIYNI